MRSVLLNSGISNPDEAAPINMESIDIVTKALSDLYDQAKNPDFEIVDVIDDNPDKAGQVKTKRIIYSTGRKEIIIKPIKIAHLAFSSWVQLASTVGHELTHVIDYQGNYWIWYDRFDVKGAESRTEINAHRWQIQMSAPVNMTRYERYLDKVYTFHHLKPSGIQQALKISSK